MLKYIPKPSKPASDSRFSWALFAFTNHRERDRQIDRQTETKTETETHPFVVLHKLSLVMIS